MPAIRSASAPAASPLRVYLDAISLQDCACTAILAFCAMQGAIPFIAPNEALERTNSPGSPLTFWGGILSQLLVYGTISILLLANSHAVIRWLRKMQWTAVLACMVLASTAWSQFPLFTVRRSLPFVLAGLFGLCFAIRYPVKKQLAILSTALTLLALASIFVTLLFPKVGLDFSTGHAGDWQGVFTSKNSCGRIMVLATAVTLSQPLRTVPQFFRIALFVFLTAMSGSRGAWMIEAIVLGVYVQLEILRRFESRSRVFLLLASLAAVIAAAAVAATHQAGLAQLLGRDATLSGRTQIWKQVWPFILRRPLLGWGYAGFWRGLQGESFRVAAAMRFIIFHAHNGFLEIWLELGAAGLFVFALSYLRAWRKLWRRFCFGPLERVTWMLYVLLLVGLYDLDENTLLIYNGLFWIIYVAAIVNIELLTAEDELAAGLTMLLGSQVAGKTPQAQTGSLVA